MQGDCTPQLLLDQRTLNLFFLMRTRTRVPGHQKAERSAFLPHFIPVSKSFGLPLASCGQRPREMTRSSYFKGASPTSKKSYQKSSTTRKPPTKFDENIIAPGPCAICKQTGHESAFAIQGGFSLAPLAYPMLSPAAGALFCLAFLLFSQIGYLTVFLF